jgi:hypothetical protein
VKLALLALALVASTNPEHVVQRDGVIVVWRENACAGFGPGDCSVRQPGTAWVRVTFPDGTVRVLARCKAKACDAGPAEIAEWIEWASKEQREKQ